MFKEELHVGDEEHAAPHPAAAAAAAARPHWFVDRPAGTSLHHSANRLESGRLMNKNKTES